MTVFNKAAAMEKVKKQKNVQGNFSNKQLSKYNNLDPLGISEFENSNFLSR